MAANNDDFLGEGTAASAFAPQKSPQQIAEEQEAERQRRRDELNWAQNTTASNNAGYVANASRERGYHVADANDSYEAGKGGYVSQDWVDQHHQRLQDHQRGFAGNLVRDPVTMGVLAAPWLVGAAGAAIPAAGAASAAAPAITTGGATIPASIAAPAAAGAAGTTAAAGTAAAASGGITAGQAIAGAGAAMQGAMLIKDLFPSGAEEKLKRTQAKLAAEAQERQQQVHQQQMNSLGQQLLAFSPQNQMMAQMFGPQAAFTGDQFAAMGQDPGTQLQNYKGNDPKIQAQVQASIQQNAARQAALKGMGPLPGPAAPLQPTQVQKQRTF